MEGARRATPGDAARIDELHAAAVAELAPQRGGRVWAAREARPGPLAPNLAAVLSDPAALVLVGTLDDVVVGYAIVTLDELRDGRRLGIVTDLYVEPEARGVSVGELMMAEVLRWCRGCGCAGIDALALPGARATKNFFERFGFTARAIVVHRILEEPDA